MKTKGVLVDTGGTLTRLVGGRWNPRLDFESVLLRHAPDAPVDRFAEAFTAGQRFLDLSSTTPPRDDYQTHDQIGLDGFFDAFAVSAELGCNKPDPRMYHTASDALGLEPGDCLLRR